MYDSVDNIVEERKFLEAVKPLEYPYRFLCIHKRDDKQNRLISVEDEARAKVTYTYQLISLHAGFDGKEPLLQAVYIKLHQEGRIYIDF